MFLSISERITKKLADNGIIEVNNQELYRYGIQQGLTMFLNLATMLLIGIISGMLWQSITFHIIYIPLRNYAGGYHAKTPLRCYFCSIAIMLAILSVMKWAPMPNRICVVIMLLSLLCIYVLAPVADKNKPLDEVEQYVYQQRARLIAVSEIIVALIFHWMHLDNIMKCIACSIAAMSIIMIWGWMNSHNADHDS